jgi:hypothetical protein
VAFPGLTTKEHFEGRVPSPTSRPGVGEIGRTEIGVVGGFGKNTAGKKILDLHFKPGNSITGATPNFGGWPQPSVEAMRIRYDRYARLCEGREHNVADLQLGV